jgi:hypothetical protein
MSIPPDMFKRASIRSKHLLETKRIKYTYSRVLMIKVTHTMIPGLITSWSKNHLRHKTKPMVMDVVVADKVEALKGKKDGPSRTMLKLIRLSILHV